MIYNIYYDPWYIRGKGSKVHSPCDEIFCTRPILCLEQNVGRMDKLVFDNSREEG